jgi:hypothetical protein
MPSSSMRKLGVGLATLLFTDDVRQASGVVAMYGFSRGLRDYWVISIESSNHTRQSWAVLVDLFSICNSGL